jgi:hypothetical protein
MVTLEDSYKDNVDLEPHGHLCDDHVIIALLKKKKEMSFFGRSDALKKRISFYGIFTTSEQHMMLQEQFNYMKAKSIKLIELII